MHTCYVTTQIRGVSTDGHCGNGVGSAGTQTRWSGCCRHDDDLAQAQPQSATRWPSATRIRPDVPARSSHGGALLTAATVLRTDCPRLTRLPPSSLGTGLVPPPPTPGLGVPQFSRQQAAGTGRGRALVPEEAVQVAVPHVLEDHEQRAALGAHAEEAHDVLVPQHGQQLGLALEVLPRALRRLLQRLRRGRPREGRATAQPQVVSAPSPGALPWGGGRGRTLTATSILSCSGSRWWHSARKTFPKAPSPSSHLSTMSWRLM